MPITFYEDRAADVRLTTLTGAVTDTELLDAYARVLASPEFDPRLDVLVDLSGIDRADVTVEGLGVVAGFVAAATAELRRRPRVALVAPAAPLRQLAEQYVVAAEREHARLEYRVFEDTAAARAWLGAT
jgi:ABC-type transporter Mla MlaB component